jgi:hypothetical protein
MELRKAGLRAEPVIPFGGAYDARVERVPFPILCAGRALKAGSFTGLHRSVFARSKSINVKSIGQECPIHTGQGKVKGSGRGRPLYMGMPTKVDPTFVDFTLSHGHGKVE